jgi:protoporphyrinogen oxidase
MKKNIAIIGAGFGGLAAAYDHLKAGNTVTIYESTDQVAGLAAGFKEPHWDWSIERFYHHWFASDQHMLGLIAELGWSDRVIFQRPFTVIYWEGKFHPFDSIFSNIPLFLLKHFSLIDVIRYGSVGAYLRFSPIWKPLEKETAAGWTRRWFGRHIFETQWGPLLDSKFGEKNARQVNMAWLWARLHSRTTRLGTFQGGFQAFADAFAARLREMGAHIRLSTPVTEVRAGVGTGNGNGCVEVISAGETAVYDQCLVTTSPGLLARMAPGLPGDYLRGLLDLKHMGAVVMVVSLKRQLSDQGYYWFNLPKSAGFPFLALVEHTNFVDPVHFGGDHLVYAGDYLENDHEYFNLSQEELLKRFLPAFEKINPQFKPDWVKKSWLFKSNYAQPIPMVNHSANIPAVQTPIPGLYFASMSQVYPWDRGTNFAVEIARRAAKLMLSDGQA